MSNHTLSRRASRNTSWDWLRILQIGLSFLFFIIFYCQTATLTLWKSHLSGVLPIDMQRPAHVSARIVMNRKLVWTLQQTLAKHGDGRLKKVIWKSWLSNTCELRQKKCSRPSCKQKRERAFSQHKQAQMKSAWKRLRHCQRHHHTRSPEAERKKNDHEIMTHDTHRPTLRAGKRKPNRELWIYQAPRDPRTTRN